MGAITMSTTGCLVTSTPQFQPRKHTAPFLLESTADPDTRKVVVVDKFKLTPITFSANVISQDDLPDSTGRFQSIDSWLYIDYGVEASPGLPFLYAIQDGPKIGPGTLDQPTPRTITQTWPTYPYVVSPGCHTATLIASHIFDDHHCPSCGNDFSTLTWQVVSCDSSIMGDCDKLPVSGSEACPYQLDASKVTSCAAVQAQADAGSTCPDLSDGGAP